MSRSGNRHGNEFVESLSSYNNVKGFRKDLWNWKGCSPRFFWFDSNVVQVLASAWFEQSHTINRIR